MLEAILEFITQALGSTLGFIHKRKPIILATIIAIIFAVLIVQAHC